MLAHKNKSGARFFGRCDIIRYGQAVSLRLGHRTALALLTPFITVLSLRYLDCPSLV